MLKNRGVRGKRLALVFSYHTRTKEPVGPGSKTNFYQRWNHAYYGSFGVARGCSEPIYF